MIKRYEIKILKDKLLVLNLVNRVVTESKGMDKYHEEIVKKLDECLIDGYKGVWEKY